MDTKAKGNFSTLRVLIALTKVGGLVSIPWGDAGRYDLIWDNKGKLLRVQVKTGRFRRGVVTFNAYSAYQYYRKSNPIRRGYKGDIDYFGIYCPETDKCYLVSVNDVPDRFPTLRVVPTKNNQSRKVRWAKDYEI